MIERVIVAGGGTGGHLFPGIAVYEELKRREPELETLFVGTARGIEARVVPAMGERLECLEVGPLKGRTPQQLMRNLVSLPTAGFQATKILRRFRPSLVLGVGGYAAGPMVAAAAALGVPTAVLEQNAQVGLTNRLLARFVDRAYLNFEETASAFPARAGKIVGNPIRRGLAAVANMARTDPAAFEMRARRVLVIGGSQGARSINQVVPDALALASKGAERPFEIVHQTGPAMVDAVRARYEQLGLTASVTPFIEDMGRAYASAALVIGRAGATSLAEICAIGRPSVLIPIPTVDDHQWTNARALEQRGAAVALRDVGLTAEVLSEAVAALMNDSDKRRQMAEAARALGRPDAAAAIVDDLCAWLGCASSDAERDDDEVIDPLDDATGEVAESAPSLSRSYSSFPPIASERRANARRTQRRRSFAWSHTDGYYGTRAVGMMK